MNDDMPSMFRGRFNATPGRMPGKAIGANPSPQSGGIAASIKPPVWKSLVTNQYANEKNKEGIRAESQLIRSAGRGSSATPKEPAWKIGEGSLSRKLADGTDETLDANGLLDDPQFGNMARVSLFKGEVAKAKQDIADRKIKLQDPTDARKLSDTDFADTQAVIDAYDKDPTSWTPEARPKTEEKKTELWGKVNAHKARVQEEKDVYDAEVRLHELHKGGVEGWWKSRAEQTRAAADAADAKVQELDARLARGVSGTEIEGVQQERNEAAAARDQLGNDLDQGNREVASVARARADRMDAAQNPAPPKKTGAAVVDGLGQKLQGAGIFGSATSAASIAADKGMTRNPDGSWNLPAMSTDGNMVQDMVSGVLTPIAQKTGMRSTTGENMREGDQKIQDAFHQFQQENNLSDDEVKTAWADFGNIHREWKPAETDRVLSDGTLIPNYANSAWLDTAKAAEIVNKSKASDESKAAALANLPAIQAEIAKRKQEAYTSAAQAVQTTGTVGSVGTLGAAKLATAGFLTPEEWASEKGRTDFNTPKFVQDYEKDVIDSQSGVKKFAQGLAADAAQGWLKAGYTIAGAAGALGWDAAGQKAGDMAKFSGQIGEGQSDTGLVGSIIEEAPSIGIQIALTRGIGAGVGAASTGLGATAQTAASIASKTAQASAVALAGGQSAGATYASEIAAGTSPEIARERAARAGLSTAIITGVFQVAGAGGVEKVAAGKPVGEVTLRDVLKSGSKAEIAKKATVFAREVFKEAAGEGAEEGIDELVSSFVNADPDTSLADAWSNAVEAAKIGAVIGGAADTISKSVEGGEPEPTSLDRVNAELAVNDPEGQPTTDEELRSVRGKLVVTDEPADLAAGVRIERELTAIDQANADMVAGATQDLAEAQATGDPAIVEAAEAVLAQATGRTSEAPRVRAVLKISAGEDFSALTDAEVRALGVTREGAPMSEEELAAVGLKKPLVDVQSSPDGSPILLDEAIAQIEKTAPSAKGRVTMTESEARKRASGSGVRRIGPGHYEYITATGKGSIKGKAGDDAAMRKTAYDMAKGAAEAATSAVAAPPAAGRSWTVTGKGGTSVRIDDANTLEEARRKAVTRPEWPLGEQVNSVVEGVSNPNATDENTTDAPTESGRNPEIPGSDHPIHGEAQDGGGSGGIPDGGAPELRSPDEGSSEGASKTAGESVPNPASHPKIRKQLARAKKLLGENLTVTNKTGVRVVATGDGRIQINPSVLMAEAGRSGFDDAAAEQWVSDIIDEEVRHWAQYRAARALWEQFGNSEEFDPWMRSHYADIWQTEFVATGKAEIVASLYNKIDSLEDWQKAMEGIRMMSQQLVVGNPTERANLWAKVGEKTLAAIRAALKALKSLVSKELSPALKAEIAALDAQLSTYDTETTSGGTRRTRTEKPSTNATPDEDVRATEKTGGRSTAVDRETESAPSKQGSPVGETVTFNRGRGEQRGIVLMHNPDNGNLLVKMNSGPNQRVRKDQVLSITSTKAPESSTVPESKESGTDGTPSWNNFSEELGGLGIPRAEMPQIKGDDRSALAQFLRARGIDYAEETVDARTLKPTQLEFSMEKVKKARKRRQEGSDRAILVSEEGHVVDGHHEWVAAYGALGSDKDRRNIRVLRFKSPIMDVLEAVTAFPSASLAEGSTSTPDKSPDKSPQPDASTNQDATVPKLKTGEVANENGVYPKDNAEKIQYQGKKASAAIYLAELDNGRWIGAEEFEHNQGNFTMMGGPLTAHITFDSREDAIQTLAANLIRHNDTEYKNDTVATDPQREQAKAIVEWARELTSKKSEESVEKNANKTRDVPKAEPAKADPEVSDDDGETPNARAAIFGEDAHIRYAKDSKGNIRLLGIYSGDDQPVRGRTMVKWLRDQYPDSKIIADEIAIGTESFWQKMKREKLINGTTKKQFTGDTVSFDESSETEPASEEPIVPPKVETEGLQAAALVGPPRFYSQLERAIDEKMPANASPAQVMSIAVQNSKAEEVKWSGLEQVAQRLAAENGGKVPKTALLEHLRNEGAIHFEEVVMKESDKDMSQYTPMFGAPSVTKYAQYTLPGGENYREVVLAMPDNYNAQGLADFRKRMEKKYGMGFWNEMTQAEADEEHSLSSTKNQNYTSSHFTNVPNYVAHMRLNDRTDVNGADGLFIEEIQSDRHQEGRQKGYQGDVKETTDDAVRRFFGLAGDVSPDFMEEYRQEMIDHRDFKRSGTTLDAPFRKDWHMQMFKRALADAVSRGKSWIGWTTGETQNDRFDLSKQVDQIVYFTNEDGTVDMQVAKGGNVIHRENSATQPRIADVVGKDIAAKIFSGEGKELGEGKSLSGLDLKVGGEGMKGFYNKMLVGDVGKYVKRWGGKVEKGSVGQSISVDDLDMGGLDDATEEERAELARSGKVSGESVPIWRVDITPEMKNGVESGQALFAAPLSTGKRIEKIEKALPGISEAAEAEFSAQQAEFGKVVGRPDLANPGETSETRDAWDRIDEYRKFTATSEKVAQWVDVGTKLARKENEDLIIEKFLLNAAKADHASEDLGDASALTPEDTVAIRIIMERKAREAGGDKKLLAKLAVIRNGYRSARANIARVMAAGVDYLIPPAERHRQQILNTIVTLPMKQMKEIEARNLPTKEHHKAVEEAASKRLSLIEKELAKRGITLDEIMGKEVFMSLSQSNVMKRVTESMDAAERMAVKMMQNGAGLDRIRSVTGLPDSKIGTLRDRIDKDLRDRLRAKIAAGLKLEDLRDEIKVSRLGAATMNALSPDEVEAELDRILALGFGIPKVIPKSGLVPRQRAKKVKTASSVDWSRPEFTDALASYVFDKDGRTDMMKQVAALRSLIGASKTAENLAGAAKVKADALLAKIGGILAKDGLSVVDVANIENLSNGYRFDINNFQHVAVLARTIQSITSDWIDKAQEYYYNSLLSGFQTMAVNAAGAVNSVWQATVERSFESIINLAARNPENATFSEFKYMAKAMGPLLSRSWSNAVASWGAELPFFDEDILNRPPDFSRIAEGVSGFGAASIGGTKGRWIRTPSRVLLMTDQFMTTARAVAEIGAMAYRLARKNGLKPGTPEFDSFLKEQVNIPGSEAWQMAAQKAYEGAFNNALPGQKDASDKARKADTLTDAIGYGIGKISSGLSNTQDDDMGKKLGKTLLKMFFLPFVRVPFNILQQGIERSINPISFIDLSMLIGRNLRMRDGKFTIDAQGGKARIVEMMAKQLQGGLLMALLAAVGEGDDDDLEKPFLITGTRPYTETKKGERELGYRMGLGPYEISWIGADGKRKGFSYGRIEPAATILGGTIDTLKNLKAAGRGRVGWGDAGGKLLNTFVSQVKDKTALRGMSDLGKLISGESTFSKFTADRVSVIMPNLVKQVVRETDDTFREQPDNFTDMLLNGVWPSGQFTDERFDLYGDVQKKEGTAALRIFDFTDTGSSDLPRDADRMIYNFIRQNPGNKDVPIPTSAWKNWTDPTTKKNQPMTAAQYSRFSEVAGKSIAALMRGKSFNSKNPSEADMDALKKLIDRGRDNARKLLYRNPTWRNLK